MADRLVREVAGPPSQFHRAERCSLNRANRKRFGTIGNRRGLARESAADRAMGRYAARRLRRLAIASMCAVLFCHHELGPEHSAENRPRRGDYCLTDGGSFCADTNAEYQLIA